MTTTFTESVTLTTIDCGECGGTYAINERYRRQRAETGGLWNCPYCKVGWGYCESALNKSKKELERTIKDLEQTQFQLRASKCELLNEQANREKVEKKLTRVKKGMCPCCNRFFTNLSRHMATKHK